MKVLDIKDEIVSTGIFELNGKGGLVAVSSEGKNDLKPGQVIRWGGNMAWGEEDFVISENQGVSERFAQTGAKYKLISLKDKRYHFTDGHSMKLPTDEVWHSQHMFIEDRFIPDDELAQIVAEAVDVQAQKDADADAKEKERVELIATGEEVAARLIPSGTKALIVAYNEIDDCDSMSDYFATHTEEAVVLGCSTHTRDIFSEMRKYADRIPETAHLATVPDVDHNGSAKTQDNAKWWHPADEHREKYSMGHGYYLKAGGRYRTGWVVRKETPWREQGWGEKIIKSLAIRHALPENQEQPKAIKVDGVTVTLNEEKGGVEVRFPEKPSSDVLDSLKANGWRWSRFGACWYTKQSDESLAFAQNLV